MENMKKDINVVLGEKVRLYRIAAGIKQKDFAVKIGVSYQQVQKYESGKDKISIKRLIEISEILAISPCTLMTEITKVDIVHNRQTLNVMESFSKITSDKDRQAVIDIVKLISNKQAS